MHVYEVFRQEREGEAMKHVGNLRAPDDALALHYAREFYSRRNESLRLWVVAREAINELSDADLLRPPLINEKLAEARQRAGTAPVPHRARE
jgi:phenylacetate-CoA oxygenase PaaH subunit